MFRVEKTIKTSAVFETYSGLTSQTVSSSTGSTVTESGSFSNRGDAGSNSQSDSFGYTYLRSVNGTAYTSVSFDGTSGTMTLYGSVENDGENDGGGHYAAGGTTTDDNGSTETHSTSGYSENPYSGNTNTYSTTRTWCVTSEDTRTGNPIQIASTASGSEGGEAIFKTVQSTATYSVLTMTDVSGERQPTTVSKTTTTITVSQDDSHRLKGIYTTNGAVPFAHDAAVVLDHYRFAEYEEVWLVRLEQSFAGVSRLSQIGVRQYEVYYPPDLTLTTTAHVGLSPTSTFQQVQHYPKRGTGSYWHYEEGYDYARPSLSREYLGFPNYIPNQTEIENVRPFYQKTTIQTLGGDQVDELMSATAKGAGSEDSSTAYFTFNTSKSVLTFAYDSFARITGTSSYATNTAYTRSAVDIVAASTGGVSELTNKSTSATFSIQFTYEDHGGGENGNNDDAAIEEWESEGEAGGTTSGGTTITLYRTDLSVYSARAYLPAATVLEPTFDGAVRFDTSGKYSFIQGPNSTWPYPWWSQVWNALYMPMTYSNVKSAVFFDLTTVNDGEGNAYVQQTGDPKTALYSWDESGVSITTSSGTDSNLTATGSTHFQPSPAGQDTFSYYNAHGGALGNAYAIGGVQWNNTPAQLWLGRGIWEISIWTPSGGSQSFARTVLDDVSISLVGSNSVVVAKPVPSWECVSAHPTDDCLVVL